VSLGFHILRWICVSRSPNLATQGASKAEGVPLATFGANLVDPIQIGPGFTLKLRKRLSQHFGDGFLHEVTLEKRLHPNPEPIQCDVDIPPECLPHFHQFFVGLKETIKRVL
jgi:hypothetical protein